VSERLRRGAGGLEGFGGSGAAPPNFFFWADIFFGPTYFRRADIFPGRHISGTT
jgi:hypothetical protein